MTRAPLIIAAGLTAALLTGCGTGDPCSGLPAPSPAELAAAQSGAEIERDVAGGECELIDGRWVYDRDRTRRYTNAPAAPYASTPRATVAPRTTTAPRPTAKTTARATAKSTRR